jgi:phage head maturation protease
VTKVSDSEIRSRNITVREHRMVPSTIDESSFSVEVLMATEDPVAVFDTREWRVIREILLMSGLETVEQVPFLDNHRRFSNDDVYGSARNITPGIAGLIGRAYFDGNDPRSLRAFNKVKAGHIRDVSVGYQVLSYQELNPGEERLISGKTYKNESQQVLRVVTLWRLLELSLTPIGADSRAKMRKEPEMADTQEEEKAAGQPSGSKVVKKVEDEKARELRATKERLMAVCPRGLEDLAESLMLEEKSYEEARAALLAAHSERCKPIGSEEPAPTPRTSVRAEPEKDKAPAPLTDEQLKQGLRSAYLG